MRGAKKRKVEATLKRRRKGHDESLTVTAFNGRGVRRPGSMNGRKS